MLNASGWDQVAKLAANGSDPVHAKREGVKNMDIFHDICRKTSIPPTYSPVQNPPLKQRNCDNICHKPNTLYKGIEIRQGSWLALISYSNNKLHS